MVQGLVVREGFTEKGRPVFPEGKEAEELCVEKGI